MNAETMQKLIYELQRHCDKIGREEMAESNKPALTTPPGIKFWVGSTSRKVSGLLFNGDKQLLTYCNDGGVYEVESTPGIDISRIETSLPLTPCTYEDLKPGDFFSTLPRPGMRNIKLLLPDGKAVETLDHPYSYDIASQKLSNFWKIGNP